MNQCSEQEIARLLPLVSAQRREQALRYQHLFGQYCCLKSYEMLLTLLHTHAPSADALPTFEYNEYGQPSIIDGPYFSISHCKHAILVAISETPIGVDIEHIRTPKTALIERTMNVEEQQQITQSAQPEYTFTQFWTQKEAYLKLLGTGIISDIKNTLVSTNQIVWQTKVNKEKEYVFTIATSAEQMQ